MNGFLATFNAFVEDTCVILVIAYLLTRGRLLSLLYKESLTSPESALLGAVLGLVGLTEAIFPGARFPYVTNTLIVTFSALMSGFRVGLITAVVVTIGALVFEPRIVTVGALIFQPRPEVILGTTLGAGISVVVAGAFRRQVKLRYHVAVGLAAGMLAQSGALLCYLALTVLFHTHFAVLYALVSVPANGFGVMLLQLVVNDARLRAESERHRSEAERARLLVAEAKFAALRARMRPHFLFNALASIAGLCGIAPEKAETAIIHLGQLMRWALEADARSSVRLGEELAHVRAYVEIEQVRLGSRLAATWKIEPFSEGVLIPAFAVQTLVENAVVHGIAPKEGVGNVTVAVRQYRARALIAVCDNGLGMSEQQRSTARGPGGSRAHGWQILNQQLMLLYGESARLRIFTRLDAGTLVLFAVPRRKGNRTEARGPIGEVS